MIERRYVPVTVFAKQAGLSYATVNHLVDSGQIAYIVTEAGHRRIDTHPPSTVAADVVKRLDRQERMLAALCKQFNVNL